MIFFSQLRTYSLVARRSARAHVGAGAPINPVSRLNEKTIYTGTNRSKIFTCFALSLQRLSYELQKTNYKSSSSLRRTVRLAKEQISPNDSVKAKLLAAEQNYRILEQNIRHYIPSVKANSATYRIDVRICFAVRSFADFPHPFCGCRCGTEDLLVASCPGVFSSGMRPRRSSGDGPITGVQILKFPESTGDPEELSVDTPSSSSTVTAGSGSDVEVVGPNLSRDELINFFLIVQLNPPLCDSENTLSRRLRSSVSDGLK
ncbi:hypothetical protein EVAR_14572_1 [Eumeta japonica]|uniref:Uncharacterized protein n=1 Tax=Eumeta variegata TaxID=151549 RepID=A0A4C1UUE1_EUMVA|nr:hypothetical protein EVAR_14572_1 [Eumeta japonica]